MQFHCEDPLNEVARVLDMARRLDLELSHLSMERNGDGSCRLRLGLLDPACSGAALFVARLHTVLYLTPEPADA